MKRLAILPSPTPFIRKSNMGYIKKAVSSLTGADVAADATERAADQQAQAIRESSQRAAAAAQEAASQTARQQEQAAARNAAQTAAAELLDKPVENVDVQLSGIPTETATATSRKRRATFGLGGGATGVNI